MEKRKSESIKMKDIVLSFIIVLIMVFQIILMLQNIGFISY